MRPHTVSLVLDIGQGAGLAGASGVRPFLPPLLAGAFARADIGIDFDGTGWDFLESQGFLLALVAAAVLAYLAERGNVDERARTIGTAVLAVAMGALLFAGSLAAGDHSAVPGIVAGAACAVLALLAIGGLAERVARRLDPGAAAYLSIYADVAALALAAISIFLEPVAFLALAAFAFLLVRQQKRGERKYAGLRILR